MKDGFKPLSQIANYKGHFQIALLNFDWFAKEEQRLQRLLKKSKTKERKDES